MNNVKHDETFIREIVAHPDDTSLRLIYADWLEEQGDPRGEFLRIEAALAEMSDEDERRAALQTRLRELREAISPGWLARLDRVPIENCRRQFTFVCPQRWEKLQPTRKSTIRYCDSCHKNVYFSRSIEEARDHARSGRCVAVDSRAERTDGDLIIPVLRLLGRIAAVRRPTPPRPRASSEQDLSQFHEGNRVTVLTGRWQGVRGVIERVHTTGTRATVRLEVGGRRRRAEIDLDDLERA
jgi:uncharacterized protein (TIGR02996 family)